MGLCRREDKMRLIARHVTITKKKKKVQEKKFCCAFSQQNSFWFNEVSKEILDIPMIDGNCSNPKNKKKKVKKQEIIKKPTEFVPLIIPSRISGERIDVEVTKKGGKYNLAGGCILTVQEGIFAKKSSISSCMIPPNKRSDFAITCEYQSFLISELFLVCSKFIPKKPVSLYIPSVVKPNRFCQLLACTKIDFTWTPIQDFQIETEGIRFSTDIWGLYALIQKSPYEKINVTKQGGLINTLIHPLVSIRIPKMASPIDGECIIQFLQTNTQAVEAMVPCYPNELNNIVNVSSMLCFTFPYIQFKRPVTIRVPLPTWAENRKMDQEDRKNITDLLLFCKRQGSWETMETTLNYTKNTFSFDTKIFGTFVLLEPRANREGKIKHSLPRLEYANNVVRGAFLVFLWLESKSWYIWIELVPGYKISQLRMIREEAGLIFIEQYIPSDNKSSIRSTTKRITSYLPSAECRKYVELSEGLVFHISLSGDIKFKESSINTPIVSKQFQKMFYSIITKPRPSSTQGTQKQIVQIDSDPSSDDSDLDFLSKIGHKKDEVKNLNTKVLDSINVNNPFPLIFYSKMEENYRIIEIEPSGDSNLTANILEKWKQKFILKEDRQNLDIEIDPNYTLGDINNIFVSQKSDGSSQLHSDGSNLLLEDYILQAQTKESLARVRLSNDGDEEYTFTAFLKIKQERLSLQIPPNQCDADTSNDKSSPEYKKREILESYIPKGVSNDDYEYKFFIEAEEMRDYLGIQKPHLTAIAATRDANAEKLLNPYLKSINRSEVDPTLLENTKQSAITNITSKTNQVLYNNPTEVGNTDFNIKELNTRSSKRGNKVKEKANVESLYKEPKVLSGKSLQILSKYIEQGLTLAVHLALPDSVITGIGFDSLSANLTLADVSYKVLTHWKRSTIPSNRSQMVNLLIQSLHNMNLNSLADIVKHANNKNEELIKDHFKLMSELPQNIDNNTISKEERTVSEGSNASVKDENSDK